MIGSTYYAHSFALQRKSSITDDKLMMKPRDQRMLAFSRRVSFLLIASTLRRLRFLLLFSAVFSLLIPPNLFRILFHSYFFLFSLQPFLFHLTIPLRPDDSIFHALLDDASFALRALDLTGSKRRHIWAPDRLFQLGRRLIGLIYWQGRDALSVYFFLYFLFFFLLSFYLRLFFSYFLVLLLY